MATTGKATLIAWAVTPRVLVLAWLTGDGVSAAPALEGASAIHTISPTTTPGTMSTVRRCTAGARRQLRPTGRSGLCGRIGPDGADLDGHWTAFSGVLELLKVLEELA